MKDSCIDSIIREYNIRAAIFDLDGTILDNNPYHLQSWLHYLKNRNISISQDEFDQKISGRTNKDVLEYIFKRKMSDDEATKYALEKEAVYRQLYKPHFKEVDGFSRLIEYLRHQNIHLAIATSGIQPNIDFMFENLPVEKYFKEIVNSSHIKKGKPDPEIYLLTAGKLQVSPSHCLVFEDSIPGIQSAKSAGMLVCALTTTHKPDELTSADFVIHNFSELFDKAN